MTKKKAKKKTTPKATKKAVKKPQQQNDRKRTTKERLDLHATKLYELRTEGCELRTTNAQLDTDRKITCLTDNIVKANEDVRAWVGRLEGHLSRLGTRVTATATSSDRDTEIRTLTEQVAVLQRAMREQAERLQAIESSGD